MTIKDLFKELIVWFAILPMLIAWWVSAWLQEFDLWYTEEITANTNLWYTLSVLPNANFLLNDQYRIIQFAWSDRYPSTRTFFRNWDWTTWWMYVLNTCQWWYDCNWSILWQWYFNYVSIVDYSTIDFNYSIPSWFTPFTDFINNSIYSSPDKLLLWWNWGMQSASLCFVYSDIDKAVCFSFDRANWNNCWWQPQYCTNWVLTYISDWRGATSTDLDYLKDYWTVSPFAWSSDKPSYSILENEYTYWQIVEWYESCWLDVWYCYWWFPIDDIFEPNQSIEDFTWYKFWYGANIRYLYSLYSDTYTPKEFFQQMLQAYNNWQINRFKTEPKALIMFVQQYVSWKSRGLLNVWFYDLWDYCNIKLWYNDLNSIYTWNNKTPVACYKNKITNEIPQWWFQFTWDNAYVSIVGTWWSWYSNASEFFWNISSMFQNWIWTVNTNYSWIIPTYILLFMVALILLRIIQH